MMSHYLLWGGLALLLLAPALLARTRWSESRPIVVCVALSVFAHLLLTIYAYATRLPYSEFLRPGDGEGHDTVIALSFLDDAEFADGEEDAANPAESRAESTHESPDLAEPPPPHDTAQSEPSEAESSAPNTSGPSDRNTRDDSPEIAPIDVPSVAALMSPPAGLSAPPIAEASEPPANSPPPPPDAPVVETPDALSRDVEPTPEIPLETFVAATAPTIPLERVNSPPNTDMGSAVGTAGSAPANDVIPTRPADGRVVPVPYRNRQSARRLEIALQHGGNVDTEAAVHAALNWLASQQSTDGRWAPAAHGAGRESRVLGHDRGGAGAHADTGLTGLALLSFLGAGETHLTGPHREHVQKGLEFLLRSQRPDGELGGSAELFARMYCHGMATLALSEAYAMSGDERIRPYLERAVGFTVRAQDPTTGGWRYRPGDSGDTSQFGWQLMALKSAQLAGVQIPPQTWANSQRFLQSVTSGNEQGLASYRPGERPSRTMTAEALVCRILLDNHRDPQVREALAFILQELPRSSSENHYYWYYGTLALFQTQGDGWPVWNDALQRQLLAKQRQDAAALGSWDPDPVWGTHGGRIFSTSMATLCLEVYYRYLPLYQTARLEERGTSR